MSLLDALDTKGLEDTEDFVGGSRSLESDVYDATIKAAYITVSSTGSVALNFHADVGGTEFKEVLYIIGRSGNNYYEKGGKKIPLPGFKVANDICLATIGKDIKDVPQESKIFNVYDPSLKKEVPREVPTLVELIGEKVSLGILKEVQDKTALNTSNNQYEPTGETRVVNTINIVFNTASGMTVNEAKKGLSNPVFRDKWITANRGRVVDRSKGKKNTPSGSGTVSAAARSKSLFDK